MEFQPIDQLTYNQALAELENIVRTLQSDRCDVDMLSQYTRRAAGLLTYCRTKLVASEEELKAALAELQARD